MLKKNQFTEGLINNVVNKYRDKVNASTVVPLDSKPPDGLFKLYFKLPYPLLSNLHTPVLSNLNLFIFWKYHN